MAKLQVTPTRMNLTELKAQLVKSKRGHKLLKDKQDELMRRFIDLISENRRLRKEVEQEMGSAFAAFLVASVVTTPKMLAEAVSFPKADVQLDISSENVMSVMVPKMEISKSDLGNQNAEHDVYPYGYTFTSAELDKAVDGLDKVLDKLIRLAEIEKTCQLLADELEKSRRRVNALEYRMIPDLEETIRFIMLRLDENERATITRLMKVKDIISKAEEAQSE